MSPRAACRLETLGFESVYDYAPGKADWMAAGLPIEGAHAGVRRIAAVAHGDVPRCRLDETIGDVAARMDDWELAVVVAESDVVLGVVAREAMAAVEPTGHVADVFEEGPTTFRPDVSAAELHAHLRERRVRHVLATTSDGLLIGLVRRSELRRP